LLLQNAAFLPLFRGNSKDKGLHIDALEPAPLKASAGGHRRDFRRRQQGSSVGCAQILSYLKEKPRPEPLADAARRLIFLKAATPTITSSVRPCWKTTTRWRRLARPLPGRGAFYLKGSGDTDNDLVKRTRAALPG